jgi:hypothetical protein
MDGLHITLPVRYKSKFGKKSCIYNHDLLLLLLLLLVFVTHQTYLTKYFVIHTFRGIKKEFVNQILFPYLFPVCDLIALINFSQQLVCINQIENSTHRSLLLISLLVCDEHGVCLGLVYSNEEVIV